MYQWARSLWYWEVVFALRGGHVCFYAHCSVDRNSNETFSFLGRETGFRKSSMKIVIALFCGIIFGMGLALSGMTDRMKVLIFLLKITVFRRFTFWFLNFFLGPITNFTFAPKSEHRSPRLLIPFFFCL